MSKYHLTEAYGNLYNPRKADETFYENLRFVDYLMQEEIEEVMESLLWEFMDYGNTLDESYDLIEGVFSDDVLLEEIILGESYDTRYAGEMKKQQQKATAAKREARREARKAAITGALRAAKETVGKIAAGVRDAAVSGYRGAKKMAGTAYTAGRQGAGEAKAGLQKLVRKGAMAAGSKGRAMEKAGKQARMQAQTAAGGASYAGSSALERSRARTAGLEAAGKTGSKRQLVGKLLRKAGAMVGRAVGRGSSGRSGSTSGGGEVKRTLSLPSAGQTSGRPHVSRRAAAMSRVSADRGATRVSGPAASLPPEGGSSRTPSGAPRSTATRGRAIVRAREAGQRNLARLNREEFELLAQYIMEDFINEGYADTYEEALEILENLSESSIVELTEMYLEG